MCDGIERYGELLANYDACGQSLDDMMALMRHVQYTKMYDRNLPHFWYSEWCEYDEQIRNEDFYSMSWSWGDGSKLDEWIQSGLVAAEYDLADFERARTNLAERSETWITGHACAYDIEKRMFRMIVQEDYAHTYDFWLEPPPGSEENPWQVGMEGHEAEVTAWTNGTGTLVVEGSGAIGSMPWAEAPAGITRLVKAEGVTGLEELVGSLPDLMTVNGLTLEDFGSAIRGFVRADGFSAIEIENGRAFLDVVVGRSDSLGTSAEWTPVSTNTVEVPAPGEQGFFIVSPLFYIPGTDYTITGGVEDPFKHRRTR